MDGRKLREAREGNRLKQRDVAEKCGVSINTVWRWENNKNEPDDETKRALASALDTSVAYLMGETDDPKRYTPRTVLDENTGNAPRQHDSDATSSGVAPDGLGVMTETLKIVAEAQRKPQIEFNVRPFNKNHGTLVKVLGDVKVCCGKGTYWHDEAYEFESEFLMYDPELSHYSPLFAIHAEGDSMEPDIEEEDLVLFTDGIDERQRAGNGDLVIVNYNDRIIIRGLIKTGGKLFLRAYNKEYEDIEIKPEDEFDILGLVLKVHRVWKPRPMY